MIPTSSYDKVHQDYVAAIEWMRGLGIRLGSGRTTHYEKVLRHWKDAYKTASEAEGREALPAFLSSVNEISGFVSVYKAFSEIPAEDLAHIVKKLEIAVNGPINAVDEKANSTTARNYFFEASVAATVHRPSRGVETILDARSDTGVRFRNHKVWIECKRVSSINKLEANIRDACTQLVTILKSEIGSGHRGMVAVDISKIVNGDDHIFVGKDDQWLVRSAQRMLDDFIMEHSGMWKQIIAEKHKKIVGMLFRMSFMAKSEARNLLVHSSQWAISPRAHVSPADLDLQQALAAALQGSP